MKQISNVKGNWKEKKNLQKLYLSNGSKWFGWVSHWSELNFNSWFNWQSN